ncbi:LexA family protein [Halomonas sp. KO116]|uniref:LexA family protein n=1 Tax=Halomonas sp. KO116 TaxID=1504981 RepID=UPI0004E44A2E|nr:translesion error-prone DNA polymerase V autoproteolytic subunit [Halomonas sp. KO116]AJY53264.1 Peptidase S24/S26A/S26B, conserved region [Halomonas sp. KO116]
MTIISTVWPINTYPQAVKQTVPMFGCAVRAGFPSPADDFLEPPLDLNEHLIKRPAATYMARSEGDSMIGAGIYDGSLLIIDRSLSFEHGRIVVVCLNGDLTVKRFEKSPTPRLVAHNPKYPPILLDCQDAVCWGVVTHVINAYPGA